MPCNRQGEITMKTIWLVPLAAMAVTPCGPADDVPVVTQQVLQLEWQAGEVKAGKPAVREVIPDLSPRPALSKNGSNVVSCFTLHGVQEVEYDPELMLPFPGAYTRGKEFQIRSQGGEWTTYDLNSALTSQQLQELAQYTRVKRDMKGHAPTKYIAREVLEVIMIRGETARGNTNDHGENTPAPQRSDHNRPAGEQGTADKAKKGASTPRR